MNRSRAVLASLLCCLRHFVAPRVVARNRTLHAFACMPSVDSRCSTERESGRFAAMKFVRTHRSLIAWMLYGFILFNGFMCSISHGQMLGTFSSVAAADICGDNPDTSMSMEGPDEARHSLVMQLAMLDCTFAGKLTGFVAFFIGLGWLLRSRNVRLRIPPGLMRESSRHTSPGLVPQAP